MNGQRLALVVAVDHYEDDALQGLASPSADAEALAAVLGDRELGDFEVEVMLNETSWSTAQRIERLLSERRTGDLVVLHFSCHGLKDESGELYLAATNTRPGLLASTAVEAAWVNRVMQRSRAQRIVLLLDCCYGGAFERGVLARAGGDVDVGDQFRQAGLGQGRGRVVITASTAMEYAFEGQQLTNGGRSAPSLFTGALVEGIRTGAADRNQDGHISLDELYGYLYDEVQLHAPHQSPSKWEFGLRGELYIARNPNRRVIPGVLPDEILDLVEHPTPSARVAAVDELAVLVTSTNLPRAAAARLALQRLQGDDSRRVSAAAAAALDRTAARLDVAVVDFGKVPSGRTPVIRDVAIRGGPLALASTVTTSDEGLMARIDNDVLRLAWTPTQTRLDATVRLTGPAGDADLRVLGSAVQERPPSPSSVTPEPAAPIELAAPIEVAVPIEVAGGDAVEARVAGGGDGRPRRAVVPAWVRGRPWLAGLLVVGLVASVAVAIARPWARSCGFADEFAGNALSSAWQREDAPGAAVSVGNGLLQVTAQDGSDIYPNNAQAPKLVQQVSGDFSIETEVLVEPHQSFQSAGLLLWGGPETYVRLERAFGDVGSILLEYRKNGGDHVKLHSPFTSDANLIRTDATDVLLRLMRKDGRVVASWRSADEPSWHEIPSAISLTDAASASDPPAAGVAVLNRAYPPAQPTPFTARFAYVRSTCV